jgi:hypothetical protein
LFLIQVFVAYSQAQNQPLAYYHIKVNDNEIVTCDLPFASYAEFDFAAPVRVDIYSSVKIKWLDIRPKMDSLKYTFTDSSIHFVLEKPQKISIEFNGDKRAQPLYLFASKSVGYNPKRTDKNLIYFEGGKTHQVGRIELKSNQTLYIAANAVVEGWICARNAQNIRICGRGVLRGANNRKMNENKWLQFLRFDNCQNVTIEDVTLESSDSKQFCFSRCKNLKLNNIKVVSNTFGDEGLELDRCFNVKVNDCFFRTYSNCLTIKSDYEYPFVNQTNNISISNSCFWLAGRGNVLQIGPEWYSTDSANIRFTDNCILHASQGAVCAIYNAGNATMSNIYIDTLWVEDAGTKLFDVGIYFSRYSIDSPEDKSLIHKQLIKDGRAGELLIPDSLRAYHGSYRGNITNISFIHIYITEGAFPFSVFSGFDADHEVKNVRFEHFLLYQKRLQTDDEAKFRLENVKNFSIK